MAKRILVVDDAMFMRVTVKQILGKAGYEIAGEAENGAIAIQQYVLLQPDAVLMDITMPVMDGISAAKAILASNPAAVILMCTALGQQNIVMQALQAGVKDYIMKPFQPNRVIEGVSKAIGAP